MLETGGSNFGERTIDNDCLQAFTGSAFGALETVEGYFQMDGNANLHTISGPAFGALRTVGVPCWGPYFLVKINPQLRALGLRAINGSAFGALHTVGTDFEVYSNGLTGLASFTNPTSVPGQLKVHDNAATFDRGGALPALECIGSCHWEATRNQIPTRSLDLPACS